MPFSGLISRSFFIAFSPVTLPSFLNLTHLPFPEHHPLEGCISLSFSALPLLSSVPNCGCPSTLRASCLPAARISLSMHPRRWLQLPGPLNRSESRCVTDITSPVPNPLLYSEAHPLSIHDPVNGLIIHSAAGGLFAE